MKFSAAKTFPWRLGLTLSLAFALCACPTTNPKSKDKPPATTSHQFAGADESDSVDFQAFLGRLRAAVKAHDMNAIAAMMVPDFAYVLGATPAQDRLGPGVFQYWDQNNLWPELDGIVSEQFVPYGEFMVAPAQFAQDASQYHGYRAGIRRVNGSWKFVYFVNG